MAVAITPIGHEDRLSLVDHLDELRTRLIVSLAVVAVAFGFCLWQNHALLHFINAPLASQTQKQVRAGNGPLGSTYSVQQNARVLATQFGSLLSTLDKPSSGLSAGARAALARSAPSVQRALSGLSAPPQGDKPVTLGIGEPFMTTVGISLLFALILSLPILLYELYGFLLPAFSPSQQRIARPLLLAIPFLFLTGVAFGYYIVLPAALRFFENFNASEFNVLVQASQYYHFVVLILIAMGFIFQVPVGILAATRAGVISAAKLRHNRRYAVLACGLVAAMLPGDAITLLLETVPLYMLFEGSLLLATLVERHDRRHLAKGAAL